MVVLTRSQTAALEKKMSTIAKQTGQSESETKSDQKSKEKKAEIFDESEGEWDENEDETEDEDEDYEEDEEYDEDEDDDEDYDEDEVEEYYSIPIFTNKRKRGSKGSSENRTLKKFYSDADIDYYKTLDQADKEKITDIEKQVHSINASSMPIRFKILQSDMDIYIKSLAISKVDQLAVMDPSNGEHHKISNWIENLCKLPIGKYKQLPVTCDDSVEEISTFLDGIQERLDKAVFGHVETKSQIIRMLAKWIANKNSKGLVIGLQGPAGTGKTSIAMEICECLGLPFGFVSLSGISTSEMLKGFQFTYEGSRHGAIVDILMKAGYMNPILFFDELDKISSTRAGDEVTNSLIHMTDHSQNHKFQDRYFADIDLDLSKCLMIFSYNCEELINPILRDRMIKINIEGYKITDKIRIAKDFLLPKSISEYAFETGDVLFDDETVKYLIENVEKEDGVRNMKRGLEEIISQLNLHRLLKKEILPDVYVTLPFKVTNELVDKFVKRKVSNDIPSMMYM